MCALLAAGTRRADVHTWDAPHPGALELTSEAVHVWLAEFDEGADRQRRARRAALRHLLGRYLHVSPESVEISQALCGKPYVAGQAGDPIFFNLSHSADVCLFAFGRRRTVGIDVEQIRERGALDLIAERFFTRHELAWWRGLHDQQRHSAFYRIWTRKEAYLKALGSGLWDDPSLVDVHLGGEPGPGGFALRRDRWIIQDLPVGKGFVGAVAVEGDDWCLRRWHYEGEALCRSAEGESRSHPEQAS